MWLVAPTSDDGTAIEADGTTRAWVLTLPEAPAEDAADPTVTGWTYLAGAAAPDVPRADLLKALSVARGVEYRALRLTTTPRKRSGAVPVAAKPSS